MRQEPEDPGRAARRQGDHRHAQLPPGHLYVLRGESGGRHRQHDPPPVGGEGDRVLSECLRVHHGHHAGSVLRQVRAHPAEHRHHQHHHRLRKGRAEPHHPGGLYAHRGAEDPEDPRGCAGHPVEGIYGYVPVLLLQELPGGARLQRSRGHSVLRRHHRHHKGHRADQRQLQRTGPADHRHQPHVPARRPDAGGHAPVPRLRSGRVRALHAEPGRTVHPHPTVHRQELCQADREVQVQLYRRRAHAV